MAQRKRKSARARPAGQPGIPTPSQVEPPAVAAYRARSEERNAAARAALTPLAPGERPWPLIAGVVLTALTGLGNLIAYLAGATIAGQHPAAGGIVIFTLVMLACSIGMWRLWYPAVLGFMVLLAIIVILFSLFLIEASNLLGVLVPPVFIIGGGYLFWKLVRVLSRLQLPAPPGR
ncbi:MAG TPA: hypothetical protein VG321_03830 [Solirubrobacteraceae bacterium]|nr:hypothetical protein [Solirubrobacteraceae bacterium]